MMGAASRASIEGYEDHRVLLAGHALPYAVRVAEVPERPSAVQDGVRAGGKGCVGCLTFAAYAFIAFFVVMTLLAAIGKGGF